jgi:hypothetical protein
MDYSYHLLSTSGIDVIIIPELDCRVNIIDPAIDDVDPKRGKEIVYATILNRELAFQAVGQNCPETEEIIKAIRWYSLQKTFVSANYIKGIKTFAA